MCAQATPSAGTTTFFTRTKSWFKQTKLGAAVLKNSASGDGTTGRLATAFGFLGSLVKKGPAHNPFKLLLVGETGSGKTSFLNLLCNCSAIQALACTGGEDGLDQFHQFNDIKLENAKSHQMQSKTSSAKLYNIDVGALKVGIIDTPGFGDSRGMEQDKENVAKIIATLENEEYINCVCLVINGRQARMSATLQYVLTEVTAILPKEVLNNVIVVFTNTADPLDLNFDPNELVKFFGRRLDNIFYIENPYCRLEKAKEKQEQLSSLTIAKSLKKSFEETAEVLNAMCSVMKDFEEVHTNRFIKLFKKKQEVEKTVLILLTAYDNQKEIEKQITKAQAEAVAALEAKSLNENFTSVQNIETIKPVNTDRHNTLCGAPGCYSNCHMECGLSKSFDINVFRGCACMNGDTCQKCGHSYKHHYHNEVRFEKVPDTKNFVDENMKAKFEKAQSMEERACMFKEELDAQRKESEHKRSDLSKQLLSAMEEFQQLGINRNYAKLVENQLAVITLRLDATTGPESNDLRQTQKELEKKLKLVQTSKMEHGAPSMDTTNRKWACNVLKVIPPITKDNVTRAFRDASKDLDPNKAGNMKQLEKARDILMAEDC